MDTHAEQLNQAGAEQIVHENTIFAEPIFNVGGMNITNSLLVSWIIVFLIIGASFLIKRKLSFVPGKLQNILEIIIEQFLEIFDSVTGSREKSLKFFPFVFTFFVFILLNNWFGLLPGVGSIGKIVAENGEQVFVPFLRGGMADLNTTLALAIVGVVVSHILGVVFVGIWHHLGKFVNVKALIEVPKKALKDPSVVIINPIKIFVGLLEIIGEVAKVASLSFRLFGNIFAGEVLLASISAILAFGLPIPFMFLEVLVGLIQAVIFAMLVLVYLTINTTAEEH